MWNVWISGGEEQVYRRLVCVTQLNGLLSLCWLVRHSVSQAYSSSMRQLVNQAASQLVLVGIFCQSGSQSVSQFYSVNFVSQSSRQAGRQA